MRSTTSDYCFCGGPIIGIRRGGDGVPQRFRISESAELLLNLGVAVEHAVTCAGSATVLPESHNTSAD